MSKPKAITACHCRMCQKHHGAPFAVYVSVLKTHLSINKGAQLLVSYNSSGEIQRQFCQKCGSSLFWLGSDSHTDWVSVALSTLDEPCNVDKVKHIHQESKVCWLDL
ncbi:GFA family protein [Pseudoalteromonas luteoviolacea]|nr:GFA family protein [Pseudoalteromonas luteoviolacea]